MGNPDALEAHRVHCQVGFGTGHILEVIDTTRFASRLVFRPYLPEKPRLFGNRARKILHGFAHGLPLGAGAGKINLQYVAHKLPSQLLIDAYAAAFTLPPHLGAERFDSSGDR